MKKKVRRDKLTIYPGNTKYDCMKKLFYLFAIAGFLVSCVSKKNQAIQQNILTLKDSYCKAPFKYNYNNRLPSYNSDSILTANKDLKETFTDQSILILNALNNLDDVHKIIQLKKILHSLHKSKYCSLKPKSTAELPLH
jgi:hypothetical protein